jgi:hypothetical protein
VAAGDLVAQRNRFRHGEDGRVGFRLVSDPQLVQEAEEIVWRFRRCHGASLQLSGDWSDYVLGFLSSHRPMTDILQSLLRRASPQKLSFLSLLRRASIFFRTDPSFPCCI